MMMNTVLWLVYLGVGSWLILGGLFFAYPTVYRLKDDKDEFGWVVKVPLYMWLLIGVLADIIFNVILGTIIFRELPHETLFTDRVKRHWYGDNKKQKDRAFIWQWRLNKIDPGHV